MPRPSRLEQQRKKLLPLMAGAFRDLGYRRTTTAELSRRCGVRENILYRLWRDKKEMFIASLEYVFDLTAGTWSRLVGEKVQGKTPAERLLDYEAEHIGEMGHHRILFAGLSETDDPEIREALSALYRNFHSFIRRQVREYQKDSKAGNGIDPDLAAWAVIGLGTVATITRELKMMKPGTRKQLLSRVGRLVLGE